MVERRIAVPGGASRLVSAGRVVFAMSGAGATVTRVDTGNGRVGPRAMLTGAVGMAYGGGLLWVTQARPPGDGGPRSAQVTALDPSTLDVAHRITLDERPGGVVSAGGLVWVAGRRHLFAVDPRRAVVRRNVAVQRPEQHGAPIGISASADGTALWTTEPAPGPVPVQLRDPQTGAVLASAPAAGNTVGGAGLAAAAADHAWLSYGTGMLGTYTRVDRVGSRLVERPDRTGEGVSTFTNGVSAYLVRGRLWALDGQWAAVASDDTGQPLARARFRTNDQWALAALPGDRLALSQNGAVVVVRPRRIDERSYADGIAALSSFLDTWHRYDLTVAGRRWLVPAQQPGANPLHLTQGRVLGYTPYRWTSGNHFVLMVSMLLRFRGHDPGPYRDGVNSRFVTFDRPTATAPFRLSLATGP